MKTIDFYALDKKKREEIYDLIADIRAQPVARSHVALSDALAQQYAQGYADRDDELTARATVEPPQANWRDELLTSLNQHMDALEKAAYERGLADGKKGVENVRSSQ